jgi:hypothetical protein
VSQHICMPYGKRCNARRACAGAGVGACASGHEGVGVLLCAAKWNDMPCEHACVHAFDHEEESVARSPCHALHNRCLAVRQGAKVDQASYRSKTPLHKAVETSTLPVGMRLCVLRAPCRTYLLDAVATQAIFCSEFKACP